MDADYTVKIEVFEGPLDLLLYLIKKEEVDIYSVSIERITSQYLDYMDTLGMLDFDIAGEFVVMVAILIYIKSRSLLAADQQAADEEDDEEDPRWDLIRQLIEYKKFKDVALHLHRCEILQEGIIPRIAGKPTVDDAETLLKDEVGIFDLITAFQKVLKKLENRREDLREIFEENFSVSDKIDYILQTVSSVAKVSFSSLFLSAATRTDILLPFPPL